jgi:hypothetical protein
MTASGSARRSASSTTPSPAPRSTPRSTTSTPPSATRARTHAGDEVADQAADQQNALARAADGFAGSLTSDDEWEAELSQAELDTAVDDLTAQASDFRAEGPHVRQAFWEGVQYGLPSS